jgi:hypothetical protein
LISECGRRWQEDESTLMADERVGLRSFISRAQSEEIKRENEENQFSDLNVLFFNLDIK